MPLPTIPETSAFATLVSGVERSFYKTHSNGHRPHTVFGPDPLKTADSKVQKNLESGRECYIQFRLWQSTKLRTPSIKNRGYGPIIVIIWAHLHARPYRWVQQLKLVQFVTGLRSSSCSRCCVTVSSTKNISRAGGNAVFVSELCRNAGRCCCIINWTRCHDMKAERRRCRRQTMKWSRH